MVNTVLTDKTGTLTCNVMEFFKASIGGTSYGDGVTEIERANAERRAGLQPERGFAPPQPPGSSAGGGGEAGGGGGGGGGNQPPAGGGGPAREAYFNFHDARVMGGAWAAQPNAHLAREFFRLLALCHTVIPDGARRLGCTWGLLPRGRAAGAPSCKGQ